MLIKLPARYNNTPFKTIKSNIYIKGYTVAPCCSPIVAMALQQCILFLTVVSVHVDVNNI